jgi:TPR repeat protein
VSAIDQLTRDQIAARLDGDERAALIRAGAEAGVAEAQAVWGQMLLDGAGVERDQAAAFAWFNRAAAQRHAMALNMVGRCYDLGWGVAVDKVRAAACFRSAAEAGLVEAMYNHATALALGAGVAEDRSAALGWFARAAEAGYAKAMNHLGSFHEDGWATPRDTAAAAHWYARAAEGGDFRGAFNHARMLIAAGERAAALGWIERAGAWGNAPFRDKARAWLAASALGPEGVAALDRGAAAC